MSRLGARRAVLAGLVAVVLGALGGVAGAQEDARPTVTLSATNVELGRTIQVSGEGWQTGQRVTVQLCGNQGLNGSADCEQTSAATVAVRDDGRIGAILEPQAFPPVACPCVVMASSTGGELAYAEVAVVGFVDVGRAQRTAQLPEISRLLRVVEARLEGSGPTSAWFGAAPERTLVLTVVNQGSVALHDPPLSLAIGKSADPTGFVPDVPELGTIAPGETTTVNIPVELPAFAIGGYTVAGEFTGFGEPVTFRAKTSAYPLGLLLVPALIALQLLLLLGRNRLRARLQRRDAERAAVEPAEPDVDLTRVPEDAVEFDDEDQKRVITT